MDRHAEDRDRKRRKRGRWLVHGKSVFLIREQIAKRAKEASLCDHGRKPDEYCARCSL